MYNKYYRLNESRWELPDEKSLYNYYPDYSYTKEEYNYIKEKNLKEGWDKDIKEELEWFYHKNNRYIITEYDELEEYFLYYYLNFSRLTPKELDDAKYYTNDYDRSIRRKYNEKTDRTLEVREVIRKYPILNPSNILFSDFDNFSNPLELSRNLSCCIKKAAFSYSKEEGLFWYGDSCSNKVYCNGEELKLF